MAAATRATAIPAVADMAAPPAVKVRAVAGAVVAVDAAALAATGDLQVVNLTLP